MSFFVQSIQSFSLCSDVCVPSFVAPSVLNFGARFLLMEEGYNISRSNSCNQVLSML
jgi:hypothetical protein